MWIDETQIVRRHRNVRIRQRDEDGAIHRPIIIRRCSRN